MLKNPLTILILASFLMTSVIGPLPEARADEFRLPAPGVMVRLSPEYNPPILKGLKVHPDNPFRFDFILDQGDNSPSASPSPGVIARSEATKQSFIKEESFKLIKYFLASLTIPEKDLWVNLSPYEKDRIIPPSFGLTEMGRDLLAEDYMLKQITASLIYPEDKIGKTFWKRIYQEAAKKFGTTNIPVNTFNKVWIVPDKAVVYENTKAATAYVVEARLKVMLEQDYLALSHTVIPAKAGIHNKNDINALGSQIIRQIVIPELTKEVNQGQNFAQLRQVYNSLILATWYKKKIKDSILAQVYADKNKTKGIEVEGGRWKVEGKKSFDLQPSTFLNVNQIYQLYLKAFKKGVYNYIKEEQDPVTQETIPRKYFSGGFGFNTINSAMTTTSIFKSVSKMVFPIVLAVLINPAGGIAQTATPLTPQEIQRQITESMKRTEELTKSNEELRKKIEAMELRRMPPYSNDPEKNKEEIRNRSTLLFQQNFSEGLSHLIFPKSVDNLFRQERLPFVVKRAQITQR